jgi:hypothetical protein
MNDKFDELTKGVAQSVTRRGALKKFGVGIAGITLAILGIPNRAEAKWVCDCSGSGGPFAGCKSAHGGCFRYCSSFCSGGGPRGH